MPCPGAAALSNTTFPSTTKLKTVNLQQNMIFTHGSEALAQALSHCTNLEEVNLERRYDAML